MSKMNDRIKEFFSGLSDDVVEDRVIDYIVEEIEKDRRLADILDDPYVRNRISEDRRIHLLENPEIIETVDQEVKDTFKNLSDQT